MVYIYIYIYIILIVFNEDALYRAHDKRTEKLGTKKGKLLGLREKEGILDSKEMREYEIANRNDDKLDQLVEDLDAQYIIYIYIYI